MTTAVSYAFGGRSAVFAGADVCREAGLSLPDTVRRPLFEDDVWDFTEVIGLPVHMALSLRRFDLGAYLARVTRWGGSVGFGVPVALSSSYLRW